MSPPWQASSANVLILTEYLQHNDSLENVRDTFTKILATWCSFFLFIKSPNTTEVFYESQLDMHFNSPWKMRVCPCMSTNFSIYLWCTAGKDPLLSKQNTMTTCFLLVFSSCTRHSVVTGTWNRKILIHIAPLMKSIVFEQCNNWYIPEQPHYGLHSKLCTQWVECLMSLFAAFLFLGSVYTEGSHFYSTGC